ncbi:MAG: Zn-dependent hydrolase [Aeromicrobium sp.]|nr:Zn-dependent hydrolase [Aeromicrobium sp.]
MTSRELTEVADSVWVATSRKDTTTSTVVISGAYALLVDPAWEADEITGLAGELTARGLIVTSGFSTHAHHDHLLWHPDLGPAPRWASPVSCALAAEHHDDLLTMLGSWPWPEPFGQVTPLEGNRLPSPFGAEGPDETIEVVTHNGHAPGHSALWLPDRRVLIAGDMLSDIELPLPFWPDDLPSYLEALDVLAPYVEQADVLIPGHGTPTDDPSARLAADRRYLEDTIAGRQIVDARLDNPGMRANHEHLVDMTRG